MRQKTTGWLQVTSGELRLSCSGKVACTWFPLLLNFSLGRMVPAQGAFDSEFGANFPATSKAMSHSHRSALVMPSCEGIMDSDTVASANMFPATTREGVELITLTFLSV
jgi:hypothetical protein